ncbi:hypothetical protein, partial [Blastomonas sp.]|uniref:hypothetical protein n=1 Tax=Blastomonas sp. TaxID=1909299 RepID=UPI00406A2ED9
ILGGRRVRVCLDSLSSHPRTISLSALGIQDMKCRADNGQQVFQLAIQLIVRELDLRGDSAIFKK